jgi:outer membrane protein assembly factor BamA
MGDRYDFTHLALITANYRRLHGDFATSASTFVTENGVSQSFTMGYAYDSRNTYTNPLSGSALSMIAEFGEPSLGSEFRYAKFTWIARTFVQLTSRQVLGINVNYGVLNGDPPAQSLFHLGGEGGFRSLRAGDALGRKHFLFELEWRWEIVPHMDTNVLDVAWWRKTQIAIWWDAGNVSRTREELFDKTNIQTGVGIGVREWLSMFGSGVLIGSIDFAYNHERDETLTYLTLGQSF